MSDDVLACTDCTNAISEGDEIVINEHAYCIHCAFSCYECGGIYSVANQGREWIGDEWYCWSCATQCERCNDGVRNDDTHTVDNESWCEHCWENYSNYCEWCSESTASDITYVHDNAYCESCYNDNCYWCDECDEAQTNDDPCGCDSDDDDRHVSGCQCRSRNGVHDYRCKPEAIFRGSNKHNMYLGFELEMEYKDSDKLLNASQYANTTLDTIAYMKHDGSINNGFELVTHPHTHNYYRDNSKVLWDTIDRLRTQYGARSWDTDTCGLHIHLSRAGFSSGAHLHRFIAFVYHNAPHMMKFAGRKTRFARFNDVYTFDEYDRPIFSIKHKTGHPNSFSSERYSAVNTQNENTIELRFFRGTMNTSGVLSALDLAQAMVEYTRELRLDDVKLGALQWEWFADYVVSNNGLYPDLYSRLDKIQAVDINKREIANA